MDDVMLMCWLFAALRADVFGRYAYYSCGAMTYIEYMYTQFWYVLVRASKRLLCARLQARRRVWRLDGASHALRRGGDERVLSLAVRALERRG